MQDQEVINQIKENITYYQDLLQEALSEEITIEPLGSMIERVNKKEIAPKYEVGVSAIDLEMGGFTEGSFINIAGENFTGKTTLVLKILKTVAEYNKVLFFSFEMYENLLVRNKFKTSSDNVKANLLIEQNRNELESIETIVRTYAKKGVKFFAIDSRMKIRVSSELAEYQKNSLISQTLSKLTQELGVIIIMVNQIALSDLRNGRLEFKGSGDMSYDSDVSFFIVKEEVKGEDIAKRWLVCSKDRINERTWKRDITDRSFWYKIEPEIKTFEADGIDHIGE
jgi:replicative DNA helicase